uniref:UPAR/Ly6 domain-containing protein n=1 Tax=Elaeophora elaphi TaxID=1147741 RepID=A0A0R3RW78_9BILA
MKNATNCSHTCYYCVSYAHLLAPNLRYQLGSQTDIFHWPTDASSPGCSKPSSLATSNSRQLHAQICTKFPICTILSPNIASISFLNLSEFKLLVSRCYMVRSRKIYPSFAPLDYIICICSTEYCNSDIQNTFLRKSESESRDLLSNVEGERRAGKVVIEIQNFASTLNSLFAFAMSIFFTSILFDVK